MTSAPVSAVGLREEVATVLKDAGMTVDEFLASDIDDLPSDELRDLWLMVRGPLAAAR